MEENNLQNHETGDWKFCLWLIAAGAAALVSAAPLAGFDSSVLQYFESLKSETLGAVMRLLTDAGSGIVLGAFALLAFAAMRNRRAGLRVVLSLLLATLAASVLKNLISRQRPGDAAADSFPSGHTLSSTALAAALTIRLRSRGAPLLGIAALIGFSRIFRTSHYLSDVLAGAGIGLICAGAAGLLVRSSPRLTYRREVRIGAGLIALFLAVIPWIARRNHLQQLVLIAMPPVALFVLWSYMDVLISRAKKLFSNLSDRRLILYILVASLALFLAGTWAFTLFDRDEGWYAEIAREMGHSGNLLIPTYRGEPFLEKPPLPYWLMVFSLRIFGANAFAARLPSALAGAAACVVLFLLARYMFDRKTALASVAVFATSFMTLFVMRIALMDAVLLLLVLISLYGFWRIYSGDTSRLCWLMLYGGAGLAFLSKYLAGVAIIGIAALGAIALSRRWDVLRKARLATGALLFAVVAGAWFVPAAIATDGELLRVFWEQNISRSTSAMHGHTGPFFYYIAFLPLIFFPWFSFLPRALAQKRPEIAPKTGPWFFLISWSAGTVILFSAVSTKLPHYIFPALPALAVFVGSLLANPRERESALAGWRTVFAYLSLGIVGLAVGAGVPVALESGGFSNLWVFLLPACALVLAGAILAIIDLRRNLLKASATLCCGMAGFALLLFLVGAPALNPVKLPARIGRIIQQKAQPKDMVIYWGYVPPSQAFYAQRSFSAYSHQEINQHLASGGRVFCILPSAQTNGLTGRLGEGFGLEKLFESRGFDFGHGKWQVLALVLITKAPRGSD